MGHRSGTWFQLARGRAMVRNRAMRRARIYKNRMIEAQAGRINMMWRPIEMMPQTWYDRMLAEVRRAREANRAWRRYRAYDAEELADAAAFEARVAARGR
jgi:hypothetical protein